MDHFKSDNTFSPLSYSPANTFQTIHYQHVHAFTHQSTSTWVHATWLTLNQSRNWGTGHTTPTKGVQ